MKLNKEVLRERHVLPTVEWVLGKLRNAKVFSKLDPTAGFTKCSCLKNAYICHAIRTLLLLSSSFRTDLGTRVLSGTTDRCQHDRRHPRFGKDREEHDKRLAEVLERMRKAGGKFNKAKCCFGQDRVECLGVAIDGNGISPSPGKLEALLNLEPPK